MSLRFQPENFQPENAVPLHEPRLIDPEQYDASEQQFAASLGAQSGLQPESQFESQFESGHAPDHESDGEPVHAAHRARFVAAETAAAEINPKEITGASEAEPRATTRTAPATSSSAQHSTETNSGVEDSANSTPQNSRAWRDEVSARVSSYRTRRPRAPRYPSLQLKFESSEPRWNSYRPSTETSPPAISPTSVSAPPRHSSQSQQETHAMQAEHAHAAPAPSANSEPASSVHSLIQPSSASTYSTQPQPGQDSPAQTRPEQRSPSPSAAISSSISYAPETSNLLEFPRPMMPPARPADELAEPVQDRLRIIEAPEITPPPPALGGILIESKEEPVSERRPGFEIPLQSSSRARRSTAAALDAIIVLTAASFFGYIFVNIAAPNLQWREIAPVAAGISALLWAAYQYLFLVYTGSTPGIRLAKLRLARFDGTAAPRRLRRWRVLASLLSAVSLALGYFWCFLDEDGLCWHDRITRTHMSPRNRQ